MISVEDVQFSKFDEEVGAWPGLSGDVRREMTNEQVKCEHRHHFLYAHQMENLLIMKYKTQGVLQLSTHVKTDCSFQVFI